MVFCIYILSNFDCKNSDIQLTSDIESHRLASKTKEVSEHCSKRKSSVNVEPKRVHLDVQDPAMHARTSATTTKEKKKISFDEYKLRRT